MEVRIGGRIRLHEQQRALAQVIEHEPRPRYEEPGKTNRLRAEVPEVRVRRFVAGHHQEHGTDDQHRSRGVVNKKSQAERGIDGIEHGRMTYDAVDAKHAEHHEPHEHDRSEESTDRAGATPLQREEREQRGDRDGHDRVLECRRDDVGSFNCAEDGDRWCYRSVTVEECAADDSEDGHEAWRQHRML
jgi:hypothetical protein